MRKLYFGSDHAGVVLKNQLIEFAESKGYDCVDRGCKSGEKADYPDVAFAVSAEIERNPESFGILCCGTGIGMSVAANRNPFCRAALCREEFSARLSRLHNNANVICFGERITSATYAKEILSVFLTTEFEGGRHTERVKKLRNIKTE